MTTIYLSSTYQDLREHRDAVHSLLRQAGYRVLAMEDYIAADERPLDRCLKDVASADAYVGIAGYRYGFQPLAEHGNPDGLSITELEYRCAVARDRPRLLFVVDEDSTDWTWARRLDDCVSGEGERGEAVRRLKAQWLTDRMASRFSTPDNLAKQVLAALTRAGIAPSGQASSKAAPTWDIEKQHSPFPGLDRFKPSHAAVYFGREADVAAVVNRLGRPDQRFLLISGDSGVGKSSLVDAGVRAALERAPADGQGPRRMRRLVPGGSRDLLETLERALASLKDDIGAEDEDFAQRWRERPDTLPADLGRLARGRTGTGELLIFIDQMEELFTGQPDEPRTRQAAAFVEGLYAAAQEPAHGLRVVGTLRSDFLHRCHDHPALLACLNGTGVGGHHALGRAQPWMLADMITRPAEAAGLRFDDGLVERLLRDAGQQAGSLPLLAFALSRLFEHRDGTRLTQAAYDAMGGIDGAIRTQVDLAAAQLQTALGEAAEATLKSLFARLVGVGTDGTATRRRALRSDLTRAEATAVRVLEAHRLLAGESEGPDMARLGVSVAHERLFEAWPSLKTWIDDSRGQLVDLRRGEHAAAWWEARQHALAYLWPLEQLQALRQAIAAFPQLPHSAALRAFAEPQWPLIRRLERLEVEHRERDDIGKLLAALGDPRPGVGLRPDGLPDIVWVPVPGGTVRLGGVDLDFVVQPFEMARYPVTHAQFQAFIDAEDGWHCDDWWTDLQRPKAPAEASWPLPNHPRETVDWYEAVAFCRWLDARLKGGSANAGWHIRLPTEWEWQQAATGGDPAKVYPWGDEWDARRANSHENLTRRTTAVGAYPAGAAVGSGGDIDIWGRGTRRIDDMAGNVWEWCLNRSEDPYAEAALDVDASGAARVLRGGSWLYDPWILRAGERTGTPDHSGFTTGFRVCRVSAIE